MHTLSHEKLLSHLDAGHIYRREMLASFSTSIDRDLAFLVRQNLVEKVAAGIYYKPEYSRFGALPSKEKELVKTFLRDDPFLLYSWNDYNGLGLGLTQLYNRMIVYNRKRHGLFELDGKQYDFRRPSRGFPEKMSKTFLLVDLVNNMSELDEDAILIKKNIKKILANFNLGQVNKFVKLYGKIATKKFFKEIQYD